MVDLRMLICIKGDIILTIIILYVQFLTFQLFNHPVCDLRSEKARHLWAKVS